MAVNPKSMSGQDTLSMHLRAFTERIPPTGSLREMSGDSDLLVHPVHVRYRIKPILLYPDYSYISYRSIPKPAVVETATHAHILPGVMLSRRGPTEAA